MSSANMNCWFIPLALPQLKELKRAGEAALHARCDLKPGRKTVHSDKEIYTSDCLIRFLEQFSRTALTVVQAVIQSVG